MKITVNPTPHTITKVHEGSAFINNCEYIFDVTITKNKSGLVHHDLKVRNIDFLDTAAVKVIEGSIIQEMEHNDVW